MENSTCTHVRIRNRSNYDLNVEEFIKLIESKFNVDFRQIPNWKRIIKQLEEAKNFCTVTLQNAYIRKTEIIDKIYLQTTRQSPFELTDKLTRTAKTWERLSKKRTSSVVSLKNRPESENVEKELGYLQEHLEEEDKLTIHVNTEVSEPVTQHGLSTLDSKPSLSSPLPVLVCTNDHKYISPINSQDTPLHCKIPSSNIAEKIGEKEWALRPRTTFIKCDPEKIIINSNSTDEQTKAFTILNHGAETLHCRYKCLTETLAFKEARISPKTPKKLYPGKPVTFKFIYVLEQNEKDTEFTSELFFRISKNIYKEAPVHAFFVPIISKLRPQRSFTVSKIVNIPPVYPWLVKRDTGYSTGFLNVAVEDDCSYDLKIEKSYYDIDSKYNSLDTLQFNIQFDTLERESLEVLEDKMKDFLDKLDEEDTSMKTIDVINLFIQEAIDRALDIFVFKITDLRLRPRSIYKIPVCFTKAEHIGKHHCCYDCQFFDSETEKYVTTKRTFIFAEVLAHPVQIFPDLLDLMQSTVKYGLIEGNFKISNSHNSYPVNVKIKLTKKQRRLFKIDPLEVTIPTTSEVNFRLRLCGRDDSSTKLDDYVHFTIKVVISGNKDIYDNVPPIFYEIFAPCTAQYRKVYNHPVQIDPSNSASNSLKANKVAVVENKT